jgi:hypothetical protein
MPTQHSQKIPVDLGGRQRMRTKGMLRSIKRPLVFPQTQDSSNRAMIILEDTRPPIKPKPLTEAAWDLLITTQNVMSFEDMLNLGADVADTANAVLGLGRTKAFAFHKQLKLHGDSFSWFATTALVRMQRKQIGRGRETSRSKRADAFFNLLGNGQEGRTWWRSKLISQPRFDLGNIDDLRKEAGPDLSEALDYWAYHRLLWKETTS